MSRKGKVPITLPKGVEVTTKGNVVTVKGPKGSLLQEIADGVSVTVENGVLRVQTVDSTPRLKRLHGLYFSLIQNMIIGVSAGFEKRLEMIGVGYRAAVQGSELDIQVGYSHPTRMGIPSNLKVAVEKNTQIIVSGIEKQAVGQFAAQIRAKRPPEPYQGKGIRYKDEYVRRKAGKAAKK